MFKNILKVLSYVIVPVFGWTIRWYKRYRYNKIKKATETGDNLEYAREQFLEKVRRTRDEE